MWIGRKPLDFWTFAVTGESGTRTPLCFHCGDPLVEGNPTFFMKCSHCCECQYRKEELWYGKNGLTSPCPEHLDQLQQDEYYA